VAFVSQSALVQAISVLLTFRVLNGLLLLAGLARKDWMIYVGCSWWH